MKYKVYIYDSNKEIKATRFVEAENQEEAMNKAKEQYKKDYNIRNTSYLWYDGINTYLECPWEGW